MKRHGHARVDPRNPQAFATCDRCSRLFNHRDLRWNFDWRGRSLQNIRLLVCDSCLDVPQEQLRIIVLPPDPLPILNARPELADMGSTDVPGITTFRLTGESGSYGISGRTAIMQRSYSLTLSAGAYGLTGNAGALDFFPPSVLGSAFSSGFSSGFGLPATPTVYTAGAYGLTGSSATLRITRPFPAASGAYAFTGHTANLTLTLAGVDTISGATGTFALTGHAAVLKVTTKLAEATGSYALTGSPATLIRTRVLSEASGAYALSGAAAAVKATRELAATSGSFALTGSSAVLVNTPTTWNPVDKDANITLSNGNLTAIGTTTTPNGFGVRGTKFRGAGFYFECSLSGSGSFPFVAIANNVAALNTYFGIDTNGIIYDGATGNIVYNNFVQISAATYTFGDIIGVLVGSGPTVTFYKNGVSQGTLTSSFVPTGNLYPATTADGTTASITANFGASALSFLPGGATAWNG